MVTVILAGLILVTDVVRAAGEVSTRIAFEESDVRVRPAGGSYDHVELDGADADVTDSREGEPQLPIIVRFFLLPPGTTVDEVAIQVLDAVTLPGRVRPVPIRPPGTDDYPETPPWDAERTYPSVRAFVVKAGDQRTYRMAKVAYSPLTYDARTQQLTLTTVADITLSLRAMSAVEARRGTVLERPETRDGAWGELRALVRSKVVNGDALDAWYPLSVPITSRDPKRVAMSQTNPYATFISEWPSVEGQDVKAVFITNNTDEMGRIIGDMEGTVQPYATLLTEWGFTTVVRTVDDIAEEYHAFDRTASIRDFIADAVREWGTYYVILAGDESVVPTRRLGGPDQVDRDSPILPSWLRADPPADFWYTRVGPDWEELWNLDGDEWIGSYSGDVGTEFGSHGFSSVYIGRLPARTLFEMDGMVAKLDKYRNIDYYPYYPGDAFLKSALVAAGPTNSSAFDGANGVWVSERYVAEPLEDEYPWTVQREYPDLHRGIEFGSCECYGTLADSIDFWLSGGGSYWEGNDLFDRVSSGYHVVFHVDHSDIDRLGRPSVKVPILDECEGWGACRSREMPERDERSAATLRQPAHDLPGSRADQQSSRL